MYEPLKQGSVLNHYKYKKTPKQNSELAECSVELHDIKTCNMWCCCWMLSWWYNSTELKKPILQYTIWMSFLFSFTSCFIFHKHLEKTTNRHTFRVSVVLSSSCSLFSVMAPQRLQLITLLYTHQHTLFITINNPAVQSSLLLNHRRAAGWAQQLKAYMHASMTQTHIHTHNKKTQRK